MLLSHRYWKVLVVLVLLGALALVYARYRLDSNSILAHLSKNAERGVCQLPLSAYKAWREGVVTVVHPKLQKNCPKLLAGDREENKRVGKSVTEWKKIKPGDETIYSKSTTNCKWLVEYFSNNLYNSELEMGFPIAFTFVVYDSPEQFLRLLKLLYRPQNAYCIHYDLKSVHAEFFKSFAKCFPNVITASNIIDVRWGTRTLLMAQINCLYDLMSYREKQSREEARWRYVINLCGKELPLVTTRMMVEKLISMNGTSSVVSWPIPTSETFTMQRLNGQTLPRYLTFYKSMTYNALSASFVYYLLQNSTAIQTFRFFMKTTFPEEHFYACLFRLPGVPGGYNPLIPDDRYFEVSHYFWRTNERELHQPCFGESVHGICIVNYADLPRVMNETKNGNTAFFQNKYFMDNDHVAMDCMEERIVELNKREYELECRNKMLLSSSTLRVL